MLLASAARLERWASVHAGKLAAVGWVCFALVSADYAGFVDLPALVTIPLWAGVAANILRWMVYEGFLKPKLKGRAIAPERSRPDPSD